MTKDDFHSLAILCVFASGCALVGMAIAVTGHWLTEVMWHLGATEEPAAWISYGAAFLAWCVIGFSVGGRVVNGQWFWREGT